MGKNITPILNAALETRLRQMLGNGDVPAITTEIQENIISDIKACIDTVHATYIDNPKLENGSNLSPISLFNQTPTAGIGFGQDWDDLMIGPTFPFQLPNAQGSQPDLSSNSYGSSEFSQAQTPPTSQFKRISSESQFQAINTGGSQWDLPINSYNSRDISQSQIPLMPEFEPGCSSLDSDLCHSLSQESLLDSATCGSPQHEGYMHYIRGNNPTSISVYQHARFQQSYHNIDPSLIGDKTHTVPPERTTADMDI